MKPTPGNKYHFRLNGDGNDKGFTGILLYFGARIAVIQGEEQEFSIVHTMYEIEEV